MAEKVNKSDYILLHFDWEKDIFEDLNGDFNIELGGKRLAYLYLSMKSLVQQENGKQIPSGDPSVDWVVKGLINQLQRMRKETDNVNMEIAALKSQGKKSAEIAEVLSSRGHKISDSGVRKTDGWKNYEKYLGTEG